MERIGFLKKNKRRFGMAKRFKRQTKVDMKKGIISDEYNVEEIAQRVAEEGLKLQKLFKKTKRRKRNF